MHNVWGFSGALRPCISTEARTTIQRDVTTIILQPSKDKNLHDQRSYLLQVKKTGCGSKYESKALDLSEHPAY